MGPNESFFFAGYKIIPGDFISKVQISNYNTRKYFTNRGIKRIFNEEKRRQMVDYEFNQDVIN